MVTNSKSPTVIDLILLSVFTILITFHPFYLRGELNLFELGIYLPGIQSLLDGAVPYRDFFHLRGPFEFLVPGILMHFFGESIWVLQTYFYVGTVITLIVCIFLAKELCQTRLALYLMVPVLIARTFPRVVFTYWGGMRYALGILSILFVVYFLKQRKSPWIMLAGIASALALLTSIEVGVCAIFSLVMTFLFVTLFKADSRNIALKGVMYYILGLTIVLVPYGVYLVATQSISAYWDATYSVVTSMTRVFPDCFLEAHPQHFMEILAAMNPLSHHFKHLTPAYCYLFLGVYLIYKIRRKTLDGVDLCIVATANYGAMMYITAFRKIGAAQFEMALQPEKILLFFMLELIYLFLIAKKNVILGAGVKNIFNQSSKIKIFHLCSIYFLIFAFIMSSIGYALTRYDKRFFTFKYIKNLVIGKDTDHLVPLAQEEHETLALPKVKGLVVPAWQAQDINQLTDFINSHTKTDDPVFMFPELGSYHFIVDRPFVGRFPVPTFAWINDNWHEELFKDLQEIKPRFAVLSKDPGPTFEKAYFKIPSNKQHYDEVMRYINDYYLVVDSTPSLLIYRRREGT